MDRDAKGPLQMGGEAEAGPGRGGPGAVPGLGDTIPQTLYP